MHKNQSQKYFYFTCFYISIKQDIVLVRIRKQQNKHAYVGDVTTPSRVLPNQKFAENNNLGQTFINLFETSDIYLK